MTTIKHEVVNSDDIELATSSSADHGSGEVRRRSLSTTGRLRGFEDNINDDEQYNDNVQNTRSRSLTFTPWCPDNVPTIVSWENMIVSTKTNPKKILLNDVTGQITGGFW